MLFVYYLEIHNVNFFILIITIISLCNKKWNSYILILFVFNLKLNRKYIEEKIMRRVVNMFVMKLYRFFVKSF